MADPILVEGFEMTARHDGFDGFDAPGLYNLSYSNTYPNDGPLEPPWVLVHDSQSDRSPLDVRFQLQLGMDDEGTLHPPSLDEGAFLCAWDKARHYIGGDASWVGVCPPAPDPPTRNFGLSGVGLAAVASTWNPFGFQFGNLWYAQSPFQRGCSLFDYLDYGDDSTTGWLNHFWDGSASPIWSDHRVGQWYTYLIDTALRPELGGQSIISVGAPTMVRGSSAIVKVTANVWVGPGEAPVHIYAAAGMPLIHADIAGSTTSDLVGEMTHLTTIGSSGMATPVDLDLPDDIVQGAISSYVPGSFTVPIRIFACTEDMLEDRQLVPPSVPLSTAWSQTVTRTVSANLTGIVRTPDFWVTPYGDPDLPPVGQPQTAAGGPPNNRLRFTPDRY